MSTPSGDPPGEPRRTAVLSERAGAGWDDPRSDDVPEMHAQEPETSASERGSWPRSLIYAAVATVAARVVFFTTAYLAMWLLRDGTGHISENAFGIWERWDARHLLDIAQNGYLGANTTEQPEAFFPLFPLMVRPLIALGLSPLISGLVISTLASLAAFAFLHRMAEEEIGSGAGRRAVMYLAFFPTALFLVAPYSESLFLAGAIPAFYFARRDQWLWAGPPAAIAVASRAAGVFLLAGLAVEFLRRRPYRWKRTWEAGTGLLMGGLPLLAYGAWLRVVRGDAFAFFDAQEEGWGRAFSSPYDALVRTWQTWDNAGNPSNWLMIWRIEVIAAFIGVAVIVWAAARREWGFATYMTGALGALVTSTWFFSVPRMLLVFFPLALFLADTTRRRPALHDPLLAVSVALAALGTVVFTRSMWFF